MRSNKVQNGHIAIKNKFSFWQDRRKFFTRARKSILKLVKLHAKVSHEMSYKNILTARFLRILHVNVLRTEKPTTFKANLAEY